MNTNYVVCVICLVLLAALLPVTAAAQQTECHIAGDSEQAIADYGQCLVRARARVAQARASLESAAVAAPPRRRSREVPVREVASAAPAPVQPAPIRVQPLVRQAAIHVRPLRSLAPRYAPSPAPPEPVVVRPLLSRAPAPQAPAPPTAQQAAPQRVVAPLPSYGPQEFPPIFAELQLQPMRGEPPRDRTLRADRTTPCILITNMTSQHRDASVAGRGLSRNRGARVDYPYAVSLLDTDGRPVVFPRNQQTLTTQGWRSLVVPGRSACIPVCPTLVRLHRSPACVNTQSGSGGGFHLNLWIRMPDGTYALVTYGSGGRGVQGDFTVEGTGEYILQNSYIADPDAWNSRQPTTR